LLILTRAEPSRTTRWAVGSSLGEGSLERFPLVGHAYRSPSSRDLRILLWGHYRIVYFVRPDEAVHIVGVFHGAMRFEEYLR
jgi:plasmid stabilization system protein ParE